MGAIFGGAVESSCEEASSAGGWDIYEKPLSPIPPDEPFPPCGWLVLRPLSSIKLERAEIFVAT